MLVHHLTYSSPIYKATIYKATSCILAMLIIRYESAKVNR
jgi:hypothetical protein